MDRTVREANGKIRENKAKLKSKPRNSRREDYARTRKLNNNTTIIMTGSPVSSSSSNTNSHQNQISLLTPLAPTTHTSCSNLLHQHEQTHHCQERSERHLWTRSSHNGS